VSIFVTGIAVYNGKVDMASGHIPKHERTLELRVQGLSFKLPQTLINSLVLEFFVASSSYNITFVGVNSI